MDDRVRKLLTERVAENWAVADGYRKAFFKGEVIKRPSIQDINDAFTRWEESVEILERITRLGDASESDSELT